MAGVPESTKTSVAVGLEPGFVIVLLLRICALALACVPSILMKTFPGVRTPNWNAGTPALLGPASLLGSKTKLPEKVVQIVSPLAAAGVLLSTNMENAGEGQSTPAPLPQKLVVVPEGLFR